MFGSWDWIVGLDKIKWDGAEERRRLVWEKNERFFENPERKIKKNGKKTILKRQNRME